MQLANGHPKFQTWWSGSLPVYRKWGAPQCGTSAKSVRDAANENTKTERTCKPNDAQKDEAAALRKTMLYADCGIH